MLIFSTFFHLPKWRALIPPQRLTTEKQTAAGSWAVSWVRLQNVHPRCSSAGGAEGGSGGVERQRSGAHCELECGGSSGRAVSGLKTRDKRVSKEGSDRGQARQARDVHRNGKRNMSRKSAGEMVHIETCHDNRRFSKPLTKQKKETC